MFKIASLVACAVAVLSLVNVTSARVPLPQWCLCGDNGKSRLVCEMNFGAWDGHTCRLDNQNVYNNWGTVCEGQQATPICWH
ncbi:hypothetical protein F5H01DRAFT_39634 [Linnemannia elongata]|nr:hypothetical protein F5H01DRAFT_39634 [Linnemannia elongata]